MRKNNLNKFSVIAKEIINIYPTIYEECPDQIVGIIKKVGNNVECDWNGKDFTRRININYSQIIQKKAKILFILESPHIDEFNKPYGPAKGITGKNIRDLFIEVCGTDIEDGEYDFLLINAVQYQCSLGYPTKCFRDKVFKSAWEKFGKEDFKLRISKIANEKDIIINACTAGKTNPKLRNLVKMAIDELGIKFKRILEYEHPSNWKREKNRAIKNDKIPNYKWKTA